MKLLLSKRQCLPSGITKQEIIRRVRENEPTIAHLSFQLSLDDGDDVEEHNTQFFHIFPLDDDDIAELSICIGDNAQVKSISYDIKSRQFEQVPLPIVEAAVDRESQALTVLCEGINRNKSITNMRIHNLGPLQNEIIQFLGPFMKNNDNLAVLDVTGESPPRGMESLGSSLVRRSRPLSTLRLRGIQHTNDDHDAITSLAEIFSNNPECVPKAIHLSRCTLGNQGFQSMAKILRSPKCSLTTLDFSGVDDVDDEAAKICANAMVKNTTLQHLWLGLNVTQSGFESAFSPLLCNPQSIEATSVSSNHTLTSLNSILDGSYYRLPRNLQTYLAWNMDRDKKRVVRRKILATHFCGDANMTPLFDEMDISLFPYAIAFFDKAISESAEPTVFDGVRMTVCFKFLKRVPDLL